MSLPVVVNVASRLWLAIYYNNSFHKNFLYLSTAQTDDVYTLLQCPNRLAIQGVYLVSIIINSDIIYNIC